MSFAIGHFAVGALVATVVVGLLAPRSRFKLTVIIASGFWAMVPDAYLASPTYLGWLETIHQSALANVFWFHRALDIADPADSSGFSARLVALWFGVALVIESGMFIWTVFANRSANRGEHGLGRSD